MADTFKLEIVEQHWLTDPEWLTSSPTVDISRLPPGWTATFVADSCSHGSIRCEIAGVKVTSDAPEYGIAQSALALLRTLETDRIGRPNSPDRSRTGLDAFPHDEGFVLCDGCDYPLGFGCPTFGTNWLVRHEGGVVVISEPELVDGLGEKYIAKKWDVTVRLPLSAYRGQVVDFASEAQRFYLSDGPRTVIPSEVEFHQRFWTEFDERLERAETLLADG